MSPWERADLRTKEAKSAQEFMSKKGYPHIRPLGVIPVPADENPCWYFYYRLPEGVLELEVEALGEARFHRRVSAFLTDPERVRDLLNL